MKIPHELLLNTYVGIIANMAQIGGYDSEVLVVLKRKTKALFGLTIKRPL